MKLHPHRHHSFVATQSDIDVLKDKFWDEARVFSYFRKGEWGGFLATLDFAEAWADAHPLLQSAALLGSAFLVYPRMKEGVRVVANDIKPSLAFAAKELNLTIIKARRYIVRALSPHAVSRAVITTRKLMKTEQSRWARVCGEGTVARIPKAQSGSFSYLVNEHRWAIFTRLDENELRGIIGKDQSMRNALVVRFLREFIRAQEANKAKKRRRK